LGQHQIVARWEKMGGKGKKKKISRKRLPKPPEVNSP